MSNAASSTSNPILARIGLPNTLSRIAVGLVGIFVATSAVYVEPANEVLLATKNWVIQYFDWLFVAVATLAVGAVLFLAIAPRANVRLGPPDSKPEFGNLAWFAMLFSAGLASGLLYWATAEPILHWQGNPFLDAAGGDDAMAITTAMRITVLHWGLHGWAFYVLAALGISIFSYRHGRPLTFRSALFPVLGEKYIDRWPGLTIELFALLGTVCGVATSIGLSAASLNATLHSLFDLEIHLSNQILIIFGVCLFGTLSAMSGLARGIRRLSEVNLWVSASLLLAFVILGPTAFLAGLFVDTVIDYALQFIPTGIWLANTPDQQDWQASWTVFYWAWWLAWAPFVSLFIARISKGRTAREVAIAVMLAPTLVVIVWMTVLGGTAVHQELASAGSVSVVVNQDYSLGIVAVIDNLGLPFLGAILTVVATFLLFTWLITSLDSATLVICHLLGAQETAPAKVFWGFALAAVSATLLAAGGLRALQAASIVIGLPLAAVMVLIGGGLFWNLRRL
ncbi:MAG: BCCT family transporter [Proteobacteria bacterium]|nr:BCCT family transporter [Pseudomonadota bacterium]